MAEASPSTAVRSIHGPPGNGNPSSLATLSNASPAASSIVAPNTQGNAQRLRRSRPDEERPRQPGTGGHRDGVDVRQSDAALPARTFEGRNDRLQMRAARDLGNHPTEARVLIHAGGNGIDKEFSAADDSDPGLIAARLDAEDDRLSHDPPPVGAGA